MIRMLHVKKDSELLEKCHLNFLCDYATMIIVEIYFDIEN